MFRFSLVFIMALFIALAPATGAARIRFPRRSKPAAAQKVQKKELARVGKDVQRLESLLAGLKTSAKISQKALRSAASEAEVLATRILANVKSATADKNPRRTAEQLHKHVRQMKQAAFQGDYRNTRRQAQRARAAASKLDEWAS